MQNKKINLTIAFIILTLCFIPIEITLGFTAKKITTYNLDVTLNAADKSLTGSETIHFTNTYDVPLTELVFHLYPDSYNKKETLPAIGDNNKEPLTEEQIGDIDIKNVLINNKKVKFTENNQILKLNLEKPLKKGEEIDVSLNFNLKIPFGTHRLGYYKNQYSLTNWYPILSVYDSKNKTWDENPFHPIGESNYSESSNYRISIKAPKDIVIVSTGITEKTEIDGNMKKEIIKADSVRDFVIMMNKNYKVLTKNINGIKVNSYYISPENNSNEVKSNASVENTFYNNINFEENDLGDTKPTAERMLELGSDALKFFSELFGKYPFKEYDIVESYLAGGAMEYPQLIQMGKYYPYARIEGDTELTWNDTAVVHETAHQWWYSLVGNNEFKDPILDESLTVFSTALYFEKKYGEYCEEGVKMALLNYLPSTNFALTSSVNDFKNWSDYSSTIYRKGPVIFEDLRRKIGEEALIQLLKAYFNENKFKNATVDNLLNIIEVKCGKEIKDYVRTCISSTNYNPDNILLTDEERKLVKIKRTLTRLKSINKFNGTTISSIFLKGLRGETIYIVKPSNPSTSENIVMEYRVKNIKSQFDNLYIKYKIIDDNDITKKIKETENMILLGTISSNKVFKEFKNKLPIKFTDNKISLDYLTLDNKDTSGTFIAKNPNNKDKLILIIFGNDLSLIFDQYGGEKHQYEIIVNKKALLKGKF